MNLLHSLNPSHFDYSSAPLPSFVPTPGPSVPSPTTPDVTDTKPRKRRKEPGSDSDQDGPNGTREGGSGPGSASDKKARKRNRAALSCVECKRRKIKCDRTTPCEACCRRGEEATCHWEATTAGPPPQPFALAADHERLKERVAQLEAFILRSGGAGGEEAAFHNFQIQVENPPPNEQGESPYVDEEDELDSDTEDAALVLEELALGRKLTRVGPRARKSSTLVPTPPVAATPPPPPVPALPIQLAMPPASRAMASLLVASLESRRKLVMDDIWRTIPSSKPVLDWLVSNYFARADWGWHLLHKPTFMAEYDAFSDLVLQGRKDEIDPLWLSSLCMTLCLSVNSLDGKVESPLVTITEEQLETLPWKLFDCAQGSLECGDWTGKPRIRTLQAIVLFAPFLLFAGTPSTSERHQTYIGAAVRIAQQLGIHKLGHDPSFMPVDDYALPPGINSLRREIPIRLLYTLLFLEFMAMKVKTSLPPSLVDCALPGNFDDVDLTGEGLVSPRPDDVATDISFEVIKYKIALGQRRFNEIVNAEANFEYDVILDLDKGYCAIIDSLPPALRADYQPALGEELRSMWRRNMVTQTISNRLLRLHRPFMGRGYRDVKFSYSTTGAIEAARQILTAQQALQRAPLIKSGFQVLNIQGACIIILMGLWQEWPENLADNSDHVLIHESVTFFERTITSRQLSVRKIATQSLQVIGLLFEAFEKRRVASEARKAAGGSWVSDVDEESFGHLLKRVGAIVVCASKEVSGKPKTYLTFPASSGYASFVSSSSAGGPSPASAVDAGLMPAVWHNPASIFSLSDLDPPFVDPSQAGFGLASEFDVTSLASLQGPDYANPEFDFGGWTALDQLQFVGTF